MTGVREGGFGAVQNALASAADAKIAQVVALVDGLDQRGAADALIAPLRSRLSQLRPARPPRLGRLMYLPLDPLIVPTEQWRPELPCIPRGLLPHLTARIERDMGNRAAELAGAVRQLPPGDDWAVDTLGALLWPETSRLLAAAQFTDAEIAQAGIAPADHRAMVPAIATLLRQGSALRRHAARDRLGTPPTLGELKALLEAAVAGGAASFRLMTTLLLKLFPHVPGLLGLAEHLGGAPAVAQVSRETVAAIGYALADGALDRLDARPRCAEIGRVAALLDSLERSTAGGAPECKAALAAARRELDRSCQASFEALLSASLLEKITTLQDVPNDSQMAALEETARDLRALELATRSLGDKGDNQTRLEDAARRLQQGAHRLPACDRARLIEIVAGPEAASALLDAA